MVHLREIAYGCEVEVVGATRAQIAQAVQTVVGGTVTHVGQPACYDPYTIQAADGRTWSVVADSSLHEVEPALRAEVVSPVLGWADLAVVLSLIHI